MKQYRFVVLIGLVVAICYGCALGCEDPQPMPQWMVNKENPFRIISQYYILETQEDGSRDLIYVEIVDDRSSPLTKGATLETEVVMKNYSIRIYRISGADPQRATDLGL